MNDEIQYITPNNHIKQYIHAIDIAFHLNILTLDDLTALEPKSDIRCDLFSLQCFATGYRHN